MKQILAAAFITLTSTVGIFNMPENVFQYKYEIVAESKSASDTVRLYNYKEQLIDTYEKYFFEVPDNLFESTLKNSIFLFEFQENARASYFNGVIVVLLGEAKGLRIEGALRRDSCDSVTIREKIFIFELFK